MKQKLIKKLIIGFVAMSSCCVAQSFVGSNQTLAMPNVPQSIDFTDVDDSDRNALFLESPVGVGKPENRRRYYGDSRDVSNIGNVGNALKHEDLIPNDMVRVNGADFNFDFIVHYLSDNKGAPGSIYTQFVKMENGDITAASYNGYSLIPLENLLDVQNLRTEQQSYANEFLAKCNRDIKKIFEHILGNLIMNLNPVIKNRAVNIEQQKLQARYVPLAERNAIVDILNRLYRIYERNSNFLGKIF